MDKIKQILESTLKGYSFTYQGYLVWIGKDGEIIDREDLNYLFYLNGINELENYLKKYDRYSK